MDEYLSRHYAHLFIRDPIVLYKELVLQDNQTSSDHFENIHSTNWQTVRFKPPPSGTNNVGWRVEFRSIEVQPADRLNSAFAILIQLITELIKKTGVNFYL